MKIKIIQEDITQLKVDAIVNAGNSSLMGGGGVDGAIHRAGGSEILQECKEIRRKQGKLPAGQAVITTSGNMPSQHVIHTVGPVWDGGDNNEEETLDHCYLNTLSLAEKHDLRSIAFPNISTGVYGFPKEKAAEIALKTVGDYDSNSIKELIFVCFDNENYEIYQQKH